MHNFLHYNQKFFYKILFGGILFFCFNQKVLTQNDTIFSLDSNQAIEEYTFIGISTGLNFSNFRDYATSPLFYSGTPLFTSLSHIELDNKRESQITIFYAFGNYETDYNSHFTESRVNTFSLDYMELFRIMNLYNSKINLKVGGKLISTVIIRENEELFNNSNAFDIISNLFGSIKATYDLSRKEDEIKKIFFYKYKAKKRVRNLALNINLGLVNSSFRNGFAYTNQSAIINEDDFFAGYEFMIFRGIRFNSALDYTYFINEENAIQFSYIWDAFRTSGHHDNFEMSSHILKFSLLYGI